ncbi:MAG TPA: alternate F1F0 ATPase, F1 subunit alpha [Methylomusa anaerophila]|uniref:ATP synthase subunit alpha n=1 Tax=Methylomusa anaerophila TaxID=1930071 RepID=A0A348ALC0_9FIRM|nr:alternate F1F0 ATPase, F1 subunit alpha [Methylomusa anaerophila]BBB91868.1 ATP synthase subunit alpha [Methylomusa anaerophila]HML88401.1 alternate F1F0 ATPase, F1 subunit alpha [Methylomusa anaerophila]
MWREAEGLSAILDNTFNALQQAAREYKPVIAWRETGTVKSLANGIAWIEGLPGAELEELVQFTDDLAGIVFNLDDKEVGVVLLGDNPDLEAGAQVQRTGRVADVPVGEGLLGRVIDPLGKPLDDKGPLAGKKRLPIEREAPRIMDRSPITVPLQTGIKVIDALIPIGRGQRQLILGDRQTGKTAIAVDTIINQRDTGVICVYCGIGQRGASLAGLIAELTDRGALDYTVVVIAEGNEPPGLRYIAPYAATAIGEYFMEQGRDVLIVYDDLTNHATTYREISLLLRRPPGREAYPGDIFYIHSRLLERSTQLRGESGGGSLTALPIIQTEAQNISAYIPTNLISITDGQLYLSPNLFQKGMLPAVDVGKSVSRVGGKAQIKAYRSVAGDLKLAYSQFEELEIFSRFGTRLDDQTRRILEHGHRIRSCLKQPRYQPLTVEQQITLLLALTARLFDEIPLDHLPVLEQAVIQTAAEMPQEIRERILTGKILTEQDRDIILAMLKRRFAGWEVNDGTNAGYSATEDKERNGTSVGS